MIALMPPFKKVRNFDQKIGKLMHRRKGQSKKNLEDNMDEKRNSNEFNFYVYSK